MKLTDRIRLYAIDGLSVTLASETLIDLCDAADKAQREESERMAEVFVIAALGGLSRWFLIFSGVGFAANVVLFAWRWFS